MAPFDVGVVRLAAGFAGGVRDECTAGGCSAGGVGFSVEFGDEVLGCDFAAELVLYGFVSFGIILGSVFQHTPPCS